MRLTLSPTCLKGLEALRPCGIQALTSLKHVGYVGHVVYVGYVGDMGHV